MERELESLINQETFDGGTDITRALLDAANIDHELANLTEDGTVALFVNGKCFKSMKAELLGMGYTQISNSIPDMAGAGARHIFALQKDNCFVIYDRSVPAKLTASWGFSRARSRLRRS